MKLKPLLLANAIAVSSFAFSPSAMATCPESAICGEMANGMLCDGSIPIGVVLSRVVRNALQSTIFPASSFCNPSSAFYDTYADSRVCMPGISSAEFRLLMTVGTDYWSTIVPAIDTGKRIRSCGFSTTSYFGNAAIDYITNGKNLAYSETGYASIAAVESCMQDTLSGAKFSGTNSIGVLPVDVVPKSYYRFIKLDGVAPTLAEHRSGNYNLIANVANATFFPRTIQSFGVSGGDFAINGAPVKQVAGGVCFDRAPAMVTNAVDMKPP